MIYTPQAALNHIYHNNDYYYVQPKPKPSFEERVEDWNKYLRSKVARDVVMSAVSDCKDKEKSFSRVVFIITSMLYIVGSAAVYAACAKLSFYDSFHEAVLFLIFLGCLVAALITTAIISVIKMNIMVQKLRKRVDRLYKTYETDYENERKRMVDSFSPKEYQTILEKNMIADKMTIYEFRRVLYALTSDEELYGET